MKILFVYWHGLGDHILASPAIRQYRKNNPSHHIGWAMLDRFRNAGYKNPNINEFFFTADAWNDFSSYQEGVEKVTEQAHGIALANNYDKVIVISHKSSDKHKIYRTADEMGVTLDSVKTEFFFDSAYKNVMYSDSVFIHKKTGVAAKDLTDDLIPVWAKKMKVIFEPDNKKTLSYWADVMLRSTKIVLADSVYFHICCACNRKPDFAWFQRGKYTFDRVKPLHIDVSDIAVFHV